MLRQKYLSGGVLFAIGMATALGAREYQLGTMARMGPGYYPLLLGFVMMFLGLLIAVTPESSDETEADQLRKPLAQTLRDHGRPWIAAIGGMVLFIVLGKYGGLAVATFGMVFVTALGDHNNPLKHCFWLAVAVTAFAVLVFHYAMGLQFPLFTWG